VSSGPDECLESERVLTRDEWLDGFGDARGSLETAPSLEAGQEVAREPSMSPGFEAGQDAPAMSPGFEAGQDAPRQKGSECWFEGDLEAGQEDPRGQPLGVTAGPCANSGNAGVEADRFHLAGILACRGDEPFDGGVCVGLGVNPTCWRPFTSA